MYRLFLSYSKPNAFSTRATVLALLGSAFLSGCAVNWLSHYDVATDQMTAALQKEVALHSETMAEQEAPDCLYANHVTFYRELHADVGALEMRVGAIPKNDPTIDQVKSLKTALNDFESLHKSASASHRCQSAVELTPANEGMNVIFRAILKLEFAKRRGALP